MSEKQHKSLSLRSFVSIFLTFSFAILVFTGAILFITPPGRVAHWSGWTILGLDKEQWNSVHICFSICVVIASIFHVYLNFKPLVSYFKDRITKKFALKMEWIAAAVLCIAVFLGSLAAIPPFSTILDIHDDIKFGWEKPSEQAPIPHAETMTLAELAKKAGLNLDEMIENLKKESIRPAKPDTVIEQLANKYNLTPLQIFEIATGTIAKSDMPEPVSGDNHRRGLGRMTIRQFCRQENIDVKKALARLSAAGIEANAGDNMKSVANKAQTKPHELADIITNKQ